MVIISMISILITITTFTTIIIITTWKVGGRGKTSLEADDRGSPVEDNTLYFDHLVKLMIIISMISILITTTTIATIIILITTW